MTRRGDGPRAPRFGALPAGLSRDDLVAAVRDALDAAVPEGASVVIAVSGGPDSSALAHLALEARPDLRACVAHVRHGLRDDAADARVAAAHAAALGLAFHECRVDVRVSGEGVEAAARRARYAALSGVARAVGGRWILVGHTADDQAETVLLNLARGTGIRGLAGMAPVRSHDPARDADAHAEVEAGPRSPKPVRIVRPLLRVRRDDVRTFVAGEGLAAVSDPTNRDPQQRRARARSGVLPALAVLSGGPGDPVGTLCRLADLARDDAEGLEVLAAQQARRLVVAWGPVRAVRSRDLEALPAALATRVVRLLLAAVRGRVEGLTADAVAVVLGLRPGQAAHVPGGTWVTAGGGWLAAAPPFLPDLASRALTVPGVTPLPEIGVALHADEASAGGHPYAPVPGGPPGPPPGPLGPLPPRARQPRGSAGRAWALLPVEGSPGLTVRSRRPGDRMRLPHGSRTVADLLVDLGVPRAARGLVPIVAGAHEQPLWVPGVALGCGGSSPPAHARVWLAPVR